MPGPVQAPQTRYISLDTDFGYDALGGMGNLGGHSMEVLEPGTRRAAGHIPGRKRIGTLVRQAAGQPSPSAGVPKASSVAGWKTTPQTGRIAEPSAQCNCRCPDDHAPGRSGSSPAGLAELRGTARPTADGAGLCRTAQTR